MKTCLALLLSCLFTQDEFSGPQPGEALPDCQLKQVFGPGEAGEFQLWKRVEDKPSLVIFVHEVTRPSVALVRSVAEYAKKRDEDGLVVHVVFLTADPTETENWMNRAQRALPKSVSVSITTDGIEGPGNYGLNRKMQITALVADKRKVLENFAIVQPSIAADALKICTAISKALGDKTPPTEQELGLQRTATTDVSQYEALMRPFLQKNLSDEEVDKKAKAIEVAALENPALRKKLFEVTNQIIKAGRLANYGTPKAQAFLEKWSEDFQPAKDSPAGDDSKIQNDHE